MGLEVQEINWRYACGRRRGGRAGVGRESLQTGMQMGRRKRREGRKGDWLGGACGGGRCSSGKAAGEMLRVADGGVPRWSEMACPCSDWLGTAQGEQDLGPNAAVA